MHSEDLGVGRLCYAGGMAQTVCLLVSAEERARLAAILGDRSRPLKHVAARPHHAALGRSAARCRSGASRQLSRPAVWRWQRRYAEEGVDGLLRDKTRPPGTAPVPLTTSRQGAGAYQRRAAGRGDPLDGTRDGRGRGPLVANGPAHLGRRTGCSRIDANLQALQGPRLRREGRGHRRPLHASAGHAVVLSIDEKTQIQALDRTQPGLPLKPGKGGTMTHDYKRHGTTTLFAALNVLDGAVLGRCMQSHRHQEFIRFLNAVERAVPAGKLIHAILDNYATHKHPKVRAWLIRHPRWTFHFTPTSGSWLNAVENFFSALTRRRLRRGVFHSIVDLQAAINRYLDEHNPDPKPFVWTKPAGDPRQAEASECVSALGGNVARVEV